MCSFVLKIKRQFSVVLLLNIVPFCHVWCICRVFTQYVLADALLGKGLASLSCLEISFNKICKTFNSPVGLEFTGVFLKSFN